MIGKIGPTGFVRPGADTAPRFARGERLDRLEFRKGPWRLRGKIRAGDALSPLGATILRVLLGCTYLAHAYYIWAVLGPDALADLVNKQTGLSLGGNFVWYQLVAHVLGGFMLVPGIATRWAVAANIPVLLVSVIVLHFHEGAPVLPKPSAFFSSE